MDLSNQTVFGVKRSRRRIAVATAGLLIVCTLAFILRLDTVIPIGGWALGFTVFLTGLVIAAYAGWARGGALPGLGSVFLLLLWMAFFPPAGAFLLRREYAGSRYDTISLSDALWSPVTELNVAIELVPYLLIVVLLFGGGAFLFGARVDRVFDS